MRYSLFSITAAFAAFLMAVSTTSLARADANSEMVVKAVMIRKFVEFVKWPEAVAPQNDMRVKVCTYGDTPMATMNAVFDKTSASAPIKYTLGAINSAGDAGNCHVVFIGASKIGDLGSFAGRPVLTVSDAGGFAEKGGMIGFLLIEGKVRYNINNSAFGAAGLKIDAQLLEIANKVVD
jgi:hypothetical protein